MITTSTATLRRNRRRFLLVPGIAAALALSACGSSSDSAGSDAAGASGEGVTVAGAWARTSPAAATTGAAYMTLTSATDDTLIGVAVDASIAGEIQIHETTMVEPDATDDDAMSDGEMSDGEMSDDDRGGDMGVMQMREVGKVELPAGQAVALAPGGLHIMMLDLPTPLELGQTFDITLDFETADDMVISVEVRDDEPAS